MCYSLDPCVLLSSVLPALAAPLGGISIVVSCADAANAVAATVFLAQQQKLAGDYPVESCVTHGDTWHCRECRKLKLLPFVCIPCRWRVFSATLEPLNM